MPLDRDVVSVHGVLVVVDLVQQLFYCSND